MTDLTKLHPRCRPHSGMSRTIAALLLWGALAPDHLALAQAPLVAEGDWDAVVHAPNGRLLEATLSLQPAGGSWQLAVRGNDPCRAAPTPVQWRAIDPASMEVEFLGSRVLTGCADWTMQFRQASDGTLAGKTARGVEVVLRRRSPGG